MSSAPLPDPRRSVLNGSLWMVLMRWTMRGIGVINTFIVARLLTPEDFGLVATAMLLVGFVEAFGETGQLLSIIRHKAPERAHYDTAWTVGILTGLATTLVLALLSPFASDYFHDPRSSMLVLVLAPRALIGSFENTGVVGFRRDLSFAKEFAYQIQQKVIALFVTVGMALWLHNFWALVGGILIGRAGSVVLSYFVHPYRPRLSLAKLGEIWSFSAWMLVVSVAQYLQDRSDSFIVGGIADPEVLGTYSVASDSATAPTAEVVLPMTRALFPIFSKLAEDEGVLREVFLNVFGAVAIICCSTATGIALVADDFVRVTLGSQWTHAVPLIGWLAMAGGIYAMAQGPITILSATGHGRLDATLVVSRLIVLIGVLIAASRLGPVQWIAIARVLAMAVMLPGIFVTLRRVLPITLTDVWSRLWRPLVGAIVMSVVVKGCHPAAIPYPVARLGIDMLVGAASFSGTVLALWAVSGSPPGFEQGTVERIKLLRRVLPV